MSVNFNSLNPSECFIVVESPNKAKSFVKYLNIKTMGTMGHFRDLPPKQLGIDLANNYKETFILKSDKEKSIKKQLVSNSKDKIVFIAADADREGEAIGFFTYQEIKSVAKEVYRIYFDTVTKNALIKSINEAVPFEEVKTSIFHAFLGRRLSDRLIGYLISTIVSNALSPDKSETYSFGRVQSVAVRILKEKEDSIDNFKSEPFYKIQATFEHPSFNGKLTALHDNKNPNKRFKNKQDALDLIEHLKNASAKVKSLTKKNQTVSPPPPLILSALQSAAEKLLKFEVKRTNQIAQELKDEGYITYHRTDSVRINPEFIETIREHITQQHSVEYMPGSPNVHKSKNSQADAHEAIRPSDIENEATELSGDKKKIYDLIRRKTIASQMKPAIITNTTLNIEVELEDKQETFQLKSKSIKFDGFYKVDPPSSNKEIYIPELNQGDKIFLNYELKDGKTTPPTRFTEASLIEFLEKYEMTRPSTFATLAATIKDRGYASVIKDKSTNYLKCTTKGTKLIDYSLAQEKIAWALNYKFTINMEKELDLISEGKLDYKVFLKKIHEHMGFLTQADTRPKPKVVEDTKCPICSAPLNETKSYFLCSQYKYSKELKKSTNCQFILWKEQKFFKAMLSKQNLKDLLLDKTVELSNQKVSLNKKLIQDIVAKKEDLPKFLSFIETIKEDTKLLCPVCKATNILQTDKKFVCSNNATKKVGNEYVNDGCSFQIQKNSKILKNPITKDILSSLLENKIVTTKDNEKLKLNLENKFFIDIELDKKSSPKSQSRKSNLKCPLCKGDLEEFDMIYKCSNAKQIKKDGGWENIGCKFQIWTNDRDEKEIQEAINKGEGQ